MPNFVPKISLQRQTFQQLLSVRLLLLLSIKIYWDKIHEASGYAKEESTFIYVRAFCCLAANKIYISTLEISLPWVHQGRNIGWDLHIVPFGVTANNLGRSDEITLKKTEKYCLVCVLQSVFNTISASTTATINTEPFSNKRGISSATVSARFYMTFYMECALDRALCVLYERVRAA